MRFTRRDAATIRPRNNEGIDSLVKRFRRSVRDSGLIDEARDRRHFRTERERRRDRRERARHQR